MILKVRSTASMNRRAVLAGHIPAAGIAADLSAATPQTVFGDRAERQALQAFTDEQQQLLDLRASDELFWLATGEPDRSVGIRTRDGAAPLLFATACGLLDQVELPEGWLGLCLEYTDPQHGRMRGLFPHGTASDS
jgi:hypothetical protein